jgi:hypothetical protein
MESLFGGLIALAAFGAVPVALTAGLFFFLRRLENRGSCAEAWRVAASRLGLERLRWRLAFRGRRVLFRGDVEGHTVHVQDLGSDTGERPPGQIGAVRVLVETHGRLPQDLELRRRSPHLGPVAQPCEGDLRTGDPDFDERVCLGGAEAHALALMDHGARRAALALVGEYGGAVADGWLYCDVRDAMPEASALVARVRWLVDLASRLVAPADMPTRLSANARQDPVPGVRLRNLKVLVERWAAHPQAEIACRAALGDADTEIRLQAAAALGADGVSVLSSLALGTSVVDAVAAKAASLALTRMTPDDARVLFEKLAVQGRHGVLVPAIETVAGRGVLAATDALVRLLSTDTAAVRLAAVRALAAVGTVTAIGSLHAVVAAHTLDFDLRRAASAAIAAIQSRVEGGEPGQLSLAAEGEAGRVSLSGQGTPEGQVSLAGRGDEADGVAR